MKKIIFTAMFLSATISGPAFANKTLPGAGCEMKETVSLSVTFNRKVKSFGEAKTVFDEMSKKIEEMAKQQQIAKLTVQSQNYNISSQAMSYGPDGMPDAYSYQMNGSTNYQLNNSETAFKFAEFLTAQKMQVNISSNSYRQGSNCNQEIME